MGESPTPAPPIRGPGCGSTAALIGQNSAQRDKEPSDSSDVPPRSGHRLTGPELSQNNNKYNVNRRFRPGLLHLFYKTLAD